MFQQQPEGAPKLHTERLRLIRPLPKGTVAFLHLGTTDAHSVEEFLSSKGIAGHRFEGMQLKLMPVSHIGIEQIGEGTIHPDKQILVGEHVEEHTSLYDSNVQLAHSSDRIPSVTLRVIESEHGALSLISSNGDILQRDDEISLGDLTLQLKRRKPMKICFSGSSDTEFERMLPGRKREQEASFYISATRANRSLAWEYKVEKGEELRLNAYGKLSDNDFLEAAQKIQDPLERAVAACGGDFTSIQRIDTQVLRTTERLGNPAWFVKGEVLTRCVSDSPIQGRTSEQGFENTISVNGAQYLYTIRAIVNKTIGHIRDRDKDTEHEDYSTPPGMVDMLMGGVSGWPMEMNFDLAVGNVWISDSADHRLVADQIMQEVYGIGADADLPFALQSLEEARAYIQKRFDISPHPTRGDLLCIKPRNLVDLAQTYAVDSIDGRSERAAASFALAFCDDDDIETREALSELFGEREDFSFSEKPVVVSEDDENILFSLHPHTSEYPEPRVLSLLHKEFGVALLEPFFGERQSNFSLALEDIRSALSYLRGDYEFLRVTEDLSERSSLRYRKRNSDKHWQIFQSHSSSRSYEPAYPISLLQSASYSTPVELDTPNGPGSENLERWLKEVADTEIEIASSYPDTVRVQLLDGTWYVLQSGVLTNKGSYTQGGYKPVGTNENHIVISLTSDQFRAAVKRLDGSGKIGGLTWEHEGFHGFSGTAGWISPELTEGRGSRFFGSVLQQGAPAYIDQAKALLPLSVGETKDFLFVVSKTGFEPLPEEEVSSSQNVVIGVSATRVDKQTVHFSPYDSAQTYMDTHMNAYEVTLIPSSSESTRLTANSPQDNQ